MSYKPAAVTLYAGSRGPVKIKMDIVPEGLDSVLIVAATDTLPSAPISKLSVSDFSFLPRFAGNADLISMTKTETGIQESNDGSGSMMVRGADRIKICLCSMVWLSTMQRICSS